MSTPASPLTPEQMFLVLHLEQRAYAAASSAALGFVVVNETQLLAPYRQAFIVRTCAQGAFELSAASGLVSVESNSPFAVWLGRLAKTFATNSRSQLVDLSTTPPEFIDGWQAWLPTHGLILALLDEHSGNFLGFAFYARENPWLATEVTALERLHSTYAYAFAAFERQSRRLSQIVSTLLKGRRALWASAVFLAILCVPVRMSALAPAEVIALNALAVTAPHEGVIGTIYVRPSQAVKIGDPLFSLDDTSLLSRRDIALKALSIARAEALVAEQRAFDDIKSKADLAASSGRVREKEAELAAADALLERVTIKAERAGVAVFGDTNDWIGRPVQTGERIMQLADPAQAGMLLWLPVADALNLEAGAPLRLFLHTQPLSPLTGTLLQTSYQAAPSPDGITAYRLLGRFNHDQEQPRIGLRGTARVSAGWTVLGYYIFRRPLASMREWTGL